MKTKQILSVILALSAIMAISATPAMAAQPDWANIGMGGIVGQAGNSNNAFIKLVEKDYTDPEWPIIAEGTWGKLKYSLTGTIFDFHFNGHGLVPENEYALIYYPDPWPGTGLIVFGTDIADEEGNVHIKGSAEIEKLPSDEDENEGAKIWLVLASDIGEGQMSGWNPGEYLFEYDLITFISPDEGEATIESVNTNQGNPNKPDKPDKPEKSNNGKGPNK